MRLYDSRSRELQEVSKEKKLKIYLCGPTVYNDVHIGNIAPVIIFDVLIRYLREHKKDYIYIHNITDIDDKIVNRAKELQISESDISTKYEKRYLDILKQLNIISPTYMPRVSDHINEIHDVIRQLEKKGYTKNIHGDVVFNLKLVKEYGEISKQKLEELQNASDFCLWKKMDTGKIWNSPWGQGRPGWHTECFAFINKYAQGSVDIHGGGIDLKFPHHENENAHCRAIHSRGLSNIWMHIGHLNTEQGKISKSNNNRYLIKDILQIYSPNVIRLLFFTNTYSYPTLVTDEKLKNLKNDWDNFIMAINKSLTCSYLHNKKTSINNLGKLDNIFLSYLENNLNLPKILTWLQLLRKDLLISVKNKNYSLIQDLRDRLHYHLTWLGFSIPNLHTPENLELIDRWDSLLKSKNWNGADKLRDVLILKGLI